MRYGNREFGDRCLKSHTPDLLRYATGGESWKQGMSGLQPMSYERWWVWALEAHESRQRRRGA